MSCDTSASGNQCTPHEWWDASPAICYDGGDLGAWNAAATQWICGDDAAGLPAWFQCNPDFANQIFPGSSPAYCCKDLGGGSWRFTSDTTGCSGGTPPPTCGNSVVDPGEECDDGDGGFCPDTCTASCTIRDCNCGNGVLDPGEECDDGDAGVCPDTCTGACTIRTCVVCDADGDGVNGMSFTDGGYRSGPDTSATCTNRNDCRDAVGQTTIKGGPSAQSEDPAGAANYCTDGWDNNCQGTGTVGTREADYDGWSAWTGNPVNGSTREGLGPAPKGDSACAVGLSRATGLVATPSVVDTPAECTTNFTISCTANVGNIRSIEVSGPSKCSWKQWSGATVTFTCERPTSDGSFGYSCFVNTSESYAASNATHNASVSAAVTFDCLRPVGGIVKDAARQTAISGAVVSYSGSAVTKTTDSAGVYNFTGVDEVPVGSYDFLAIKTGYYAGRRTSINITSSPTLVDFNLSEEQCTAQCTFGGVCDYDRCVGRNGCPAAKMFDVSDPALFFATCQGAPNGTRREYSETEMANCCLGPVESKALSAAPMAVESCASQLIPFERIVNYNGKPHLLTVVTYRPCK